MWVFFQSSQYASFNVTVIVAPLYLPISINRITDPRAEFIAARAVYWDTKQ